MADTPSPAASRDNARQTARSHSRRTFVYLLAQGLLLDVWLLLLWQVPALRRVFLPIQGSDGVLLSYAWPDFVVAASLSIGAALLIARGSRYGVAVAWMTAGALVYSAVRALGWALFTGFSWPAVAIMMPLAAGSLWAARHVTYRYAATPPARSAGAAAVSPAPAA